MKNIWVRFGVVIIGIVGMYFIVSGNGTDTSGPVDGPTVVEEQPLTEEEKEQLSQRFHNENLGFIAQVHMLDAGHYLVTSRYREATADPDYPFEQLTWVEKRDGEIKITPLTSGDTSIKLLTEQEKPFFLSGTGFYVVFATGEGVNGEKRAGKAYVFQVRQGEAPKQIMESEGVFHDFYMDADRLLVLVEKVAVDDRNQFPSELTPAELRHQQWKDGKWRLIKTEKLGAGGSGETES